MSQLQRARAEIFINSILDLQVSCPEYLGLCRDKWSNNFRVLGIGCHTYRFVKRENEKDFLNAIQVFNARTIQ